MTRQPSWLGALSVILLGAFNSAPALAATPKFTAADRSATAVPQRARAELRLELGRGKAWLGQAIPITLSAQFRDLDGVTLEGVPQLKSEAIITSDLSREPRQATQIIDGEPVLVATWTGSVTPSTDGPLALSVELPVRIRFHEAAPQPVPRAPEQEEDPFESLLDVDPSDPSSIQRVFQSMQRRMPMGFDEPLVGRSHDEALTLKALSRPLSVQAVPSDGQPPTFSGAVGRFNLRASLPDATGQANQPLTLTVTVKGDGDLDRVDLNGLQSSADWKAYPIGPKAETTPAGKKLDHKTFEQVLIPTHGGELTLPSLELSEFDPIAGRYLQVKTTPLTVDVSGPAAPEPSNSRHGAEPALPLASAQAPPVPASLPAPAPSALIDSPLTMAWRLAPILALLLAASLVRLFRKPDPERALHRALRRSARQGSVAAFFDAARRLIVVHFSKRWHVTEAEVTAQALRAELGANAEPLVDALDTSDALRFGKRVLAPVELGALCSSIEESLRKSA